MSSRLSRRAWQRACSSLPARLGAPRTPAATLQQLPATARYSFAVRLRSLLTETAWNIGVVDQPAADIVQRGITGPVRWLPGQAACGSLADPACRLRPDGSRKLYAEHINEQARGSIWSAQVERGADPAGARFAPLLSGNFHMSYPFPFEDAQGRSLLTAETWEAGAVLLWEDLDGLSRLLPVMSGAPAVDPTLWRAADRWWLFCGLQDADPDGRLYAFHCKGDRLDGPWTPHRRNPIKTGRRGSRPAGPIFRAGDVLVRPSQDCSRDYGEAVILQAIVRLDEDGFEETELRRLSPPPGEYPHGLHTFCPAGEVTLIDGRRQSLDLRGALHRLGRGLRGREGALRRAVGSA